VAVPAPHDPAAPVTKRGWLPTQKWWAALAGSVASVLASWLVTGEFDDVERGMCATALTALVAAYWKGNATTPGGVPDAEVRSWRPRGEAGYGVVEAILIVFLVAVVLIVLFRLL
jgi:hypothetical protein